MPKEKKMEKVEEKAEEKSEVTPEEVVEEFTPELTPEQVKAKLRALDKKEASAEALARWIPKTALGRQVKSGDIKEIDVVLDLNKRILEAEIVESLVPLETDLLAIGQAKGKFGGGKRRAWRQTQKKTMEGNRITFSSMAIVGDRKGHIGVGLGESKETLASREKALRRAKLNLIRITRGFENREDTIRSPHTVPFKVQGKCGSVRLTLYPAPRGTGLVVGNECKKILQLAGIQDVYSSRRGKTRTTFNLANACIEALKKTNFEVIQ